MKKRIFPVNLQPESAAFATGVGPPRPFPSRATKPPDGPIATCPYRRSALVQLPVSYTPELRFIGHISRDVGSPESGLCQLMVQNHINPPAFPPLRLHHVFHPASALLHSSLPLAHTLRRITAILYRPTLPQHHAVDHE